MALRPKYRWIISCAGIVSGGTTLARMTPVIFARSRRAFVKRPSTSRPISSPVRSRSVVRRQLWTIVAPSKTPRTMLVLPMSIARSMVPEVPVDLARHYTLDVTVHAHEQRAAIVDPCRDAALRTRSRRPGHARSLRRWRQRAPGVEDSIEPPFEQVVVPARE